MQSTEHHALEANGADANHAISHRRRIRRQTRGRSGRPCVSFNLTSRNLSPSALLADAGTMAAAKQNVVFFHPDLGIGGAERLVIDAAVGLQQRGHRVTIFTSHCDPSHCFEEARDGELLLHGARSYEPALMFSQAEIALRDPRRAR